MTIMSNENWESFIKMQNEMMLAEVQKLFRSLKREHCDGCEPRYECPTCKPEFDRMRIYMRKLTDVAFQDKEVVKDE